MIALRLLACFWPVFLIKDASLLERPRAWLRSLGEGPALLPAPGVYQLPAPPAPTWLAKLLGCAFCIGTWTSYGVWQAPDWAIEIMAGASAAYLLDRLWDALDRVGTRPITSSGG